MNSAPLCETKTKLVDEFERKMLGCWLGKSVGGVLGAPFEGYPAVNKISCYTPVPEKALPNDDLELQVMYACALAKMDKPRVDREVLADIWLAHMNFNADEYAVALRNLKLGVRPPHSGRYDNYFSDGMGAAIRSELWACLAPGRPELAVEYAREDACIDHAGDGVWAEVLFAALESMAFVESDIDKLLDCGLSFIPPGCGIHRSVSDTRKWWSETRDWLEVRDRIFAKYSSEFATCVLPNVPFTILALLAGGGDFGKTVCAAVNCGMDTDCSAATAGAILGVVSPESITADWLKPVGRELVVRDTAIVNLKTPGTIDEFAKLIVALKDRLGEFSAPVEAPAPDWGKLQIDAEVCAFDNLYWWNIPLRDFKGEWRRIKLPGLLNKLDLAPFKGAKQILLKLKFKIEDESEHCIMFNTPSTCHVYLDPDWSAEALNDSRDMLFGRTRPFFGEEPERFPSRDLMFNTVFSPCLGGAPLNQIKRHLKLKPGVHELLVSIVPQAGDRWVRWGMGVGKMSDNAFIPEAFFRARS